MPYGWSPGGVPLDRPEWAVPYEEGIPQGVPDVYLNASIPYKPNLNPKFCQYRHPNQLQCGAYKAGDSDLCLAHGKSIVSGLISTTRS